MGRFVHKHKTRYRSFFTALDDRKSLAGYKKGMNQNAQQYHPFSPVVGAFVFKSDSQVLEVHKPENIKHQVGVVKEIFGPSSRGPQLDYAILVEKMDGAFERGQSQEWKCFRTLVASTAAYAKEQQEVLAQMEAKFADGKPTDELSLPGHSPSSPGTGREAHTRQYGV